MSSAFFFSFLDDYLEDFLDARLCASYEFSVPFASSCRFFSPIFALL